jgi:hypothetical protein
LRNTGREQAESLLVFPQSFAKADFGHIEA